MLLKYEGRAAEVSQPIGGGRSLLVARGDSIEVPDDLAAKLLDEQPAEWAAAKKRPVKPTTKEEVL